MVVHAWNIEGKNVNDQSRTTQPASRGISRNLISAVIVGLALVGAGAAWTLTQTQTPVAVATPQVDVAANATATASMQPVALPLMTGLPDFTPWWKQWGRL